MCTVDKSKVEISQNFVAFSEYTNFNKFRFLKESANIYNPWIELVKNLCKKSICKDVSKLCKCKKTLKNGRLLNISAIYTAQYVGI